MAFARLVLDYLRVLIWPAVFLFGLLVFRGSVRALLSRVATHGEEVSATFGGLVGFSAKLLA